LKRLDPSQSLSGVATLRNEIDDSIAPIRIIGTVLVIFATVTLAIAVVGVYGIVAGTVTRRTREVGLRMALGARPSGILTALLTDTLRTCAWSVVLGVSVSIWLHETLGASLYNLISVSPVSLAGLSAILIGSSLVAAFVPARRAASIDPAVALRSL
jgi:ABC-type antimicrobial peptide transport system permease subunit